MAKKIRIVSKIDGFRRCGVAHGATATHHDPDRFTEDELAMLNDEPNLIVDEVTVKDVKGHVTDQDGADKK